MNILCTICARGGSKGVANKALKNIQGIPLIGVTIKQALSSKLFDEVIVSTDSKKIQKTAIKFGAKSWFLRPKILSNDYSSKILAIRHAFMQSEKYFKKNFDICVDLDITSPLRNIDDIKKALKLFLKNKKIKNLFSVCEARRNPYFNMVEVKNRKVSIVKKYKKKNNLTSSSRWSSFYRRQSAPKVFDMNASIYIWRRSRLLKSNALFSKDTGIFLMPQERSIDIDSYFDFFLVKQILKNENKKFF
jgi:CMP-N,N'-diacetyllegionaminic acid synthase